MQSPASDMQPVGYVLRYVWRYRLSQVAILLAVLGAVGASVGARYSMKFLVDAMAQGPGIGAAWSALAVFVFFVGADNFLWRVAGFASAHSFPRIVADLRLDLFRHLLGHSARYFNERFSGALASRISATATALNTVGNAFIWNVLPPAAATIGSLVALGTVSWAMVGALSVAAAAIAGVIAWAALRGRTLHSDYAERAASVAGHIVDAVGNHPTVRIFAGREREAARLAVAVGDETNAQHRALVYIEWLRLGHAGAVWILSGAMLAWSVWLWEDGTISAGDVVVCGSLTLGLLQASRDLAVAVVELGHHWSRVAEAIRTLMVPHDMPDAPDAEHFHASGGTIRFEDVSFVHDAHRSVLDGVDIDIGAGERIGIVGPSGAGKSTLLALVQRLYPATSGRILIDGQDVASLTQESLRGAIAVVPQDIALFHRTILENIRYGRPDASDDEVVAAACAACCDDFIRALPEGYATLAGERGLRLSAGQKQRIAIARALLTDASIILLDEATSALDVESEIAVQRALGALAQGRTIVAVAHRLSTIAGFDRVLVIEQGRVVEEGAPGDLRRRGGVFARLWQAQQDELASYRPSRNPPPRRPILQFDPAE